MLRGLFQRVPRPTLVTSSISPVSFVQLREAGTRAKRIDVLLVKDIRGLGRAGDKVEVAPGYARNFLVPQKMAMYAIPKNVAIVKEMFGDTVEAEEAKKRAIAEAAANDPTAPTGFPLFDATSIFVRSLNFRYLRNMGASGETLLNPVTREDVLTRLRDARLHHVRVSDIIFPNEATSISAFGSHPIVLNLHAPDHSAAIPLTLKVENKALVQVASAAKAMKNQAREEGKDAKDEKGKGKK